MFEVHQAPPCGYSHHGTGHPTQMTSYDLGSVCITPPLASDGSDMTRYQHQRHHTAVPHITPTSAYRPHIESNKMAAYSQQQSKQNCVFPTRTRYPGDQVFFMDEYGDLPPTPESLYEQEPTGPDFSSVYKHAQDTLGWGLGYDQEQQLPHQGSPCPSVGAASSISGCSSPYNGMKCEELNQHLSFITANSRSNLQQHQQPMGSNKVQPTSTFDSEKEDIKDIVSIVDSLMDINSSHESTTNNNRINTEGYKVLKIEPENIYPFETDSLSPPTSSSSCTYSSFSCENFPKSEPIDIKIEKDSVDFFSAVTPPLSLDNITSTTTTTTTTRALKSTDGESGRAATSKSPPSYNDYIKMFSEKTSCLDSSVPSGGYGCEADDFCFTGSDIQQQPGMTFQDMCVSAGVLNGNYFMAFLTS